MDIVKIDESKRSKFYMSLYKYCQIVNNKRGVNTVITTHSNHVANITVIVNGKRGIAEKHLVIIYDNLTEEWVIYSDGYEYRMLMLSDITNIMKNMVQKLNTILTKL